MALLALDQRLPTAPAPAADLRWLTAASAAALAALTGLALTWSMLAPANPARLVERVEAEDLAVAGDSSRPQVQGLEAELGSLYASVEGPSDRRYAGIDTQVITVAEGDTLSSLLQAAGATKDDAAAAVKAIAAVYDPRQIRDGFRLTMTLGVPQTRSKLRASAMPVPTARDVTAEDATGRVRLMSIAFKPEVDREVVAQRDDTGSYGARATQKKLTAQLYRASGVIDRSLFLSAAAAGVPDRVTSQLMYLFSYDVDFQRDINPGDGFEVFFTRYFDEYGNAVKSGDIMFAALTLKGERKALYRYSRGDGSEPEYIDGDGKSIKKSLLRTPVESARITSGFGMREHPILGYTRMHKGVDFGAEEGTPIFASGDGEIEVAGPSSGYGNYIRIRHTDRYETAYGHMQGFAKGIHEGVHVRQGDVIGYVGMTGLATGPHLHYEILIDGEQVNPAGVQLDTNQGLSGAGLVAFRKAKAQTDAMIANTPLNAPVETAEADTMATELRGPRN